MSHVSYLFATVYFTKNFICKYMFYQGFERIIFIKAFLGKQHLYVGFIPLHLCHLHDGGHFTGGGNQNKPKT